MFYSIRIMCKIGGFNIVRDANDGIPVHINNSQYRSKSNYDVSCSDDHSAFARTCLADVHLGNGSKCVWLKLALRFIEYVNNLVVYANLLACFFIEASSEEELCPSLLCMCLLPVVLKSSLSI